MIKTFRGLLGDNESMIINLHTIKGTMGYQIKRFELMPNDPGGVSTEHVVQISKIESADFVTTPTTVVDFSNQDLLAAGFVSNNTNASAYPIGQTIIFDSEIFNQDIYLVHKTENTTAPVNYYLELELMKLDTNETVMATLKDMRSTSTP